jgi:hypothetical protein
MRRKAALCIVAALALLAVLTACSAGNDATPAIAAVTPSAESPTALPESAVSTATAALTSTPSPLPPTHTATPSPIPTATAVTYDLAITAADVYLYPIPDIYSGDRVTVQVLPTVPDTVLPENVTVDVFVDGALVSSGVLDGRNLAGQAIGLFQWVWDTTDAIGEYQIQVVLDQNDTIIIGDEDPHNNETTVTAVVRDRSELPAAERNASWVTAETVCCIVHAVTGTAAYRDLSDLLVAVETAVQQASSRLREPVGRKLHVYFIDRVLGQGGYAGSSMVISYLDRNYVGRGLHHVLVHEATHLLDRQFAPQRIIFLAEGVAVWASDGHYKTENLDQRAAALLVLDQYVPLAELIDDFYPVQHEVGYLQAAGLVTYLVGLQGWDHFRAFYTDVTQDDAPTLSAAVDLNLQIYYNKTLAELETEWLAYLASIPLDDAVVSDLATTIRYFNVVRDYQIHYDPTAYFLTAWLPYPQEVEEQGNPADLMRHPEAEVNIALEVMFHDADMALRNSDYNRANVLLDSIVRVLNNEGAFIDPLATSYLNVVRKATSMGYQVQQVNLDGNQALVWATTPVNSNLVQLNLALRGNGWVLLSN